VVPNEKILVGRDSFPVSKSRQPKAPKQPADKSQQTMCAHRGEDPKGEGESLKPKKKEFELTDGREN